MKNASKVKWVYFKGKCLKKAVPTAKLDKKAIRSPFLTPKILFWVRRNLFGKRASHAERGRREGKKITMLTNKPVGHQWRSDHCCFLYHCPWMQRSHCGDQFQNVSFKKQERVLGLFLDLPWHFPSPVHTYRVFFWFTWFGNGNIYIQYTMLQALQV